MLAQYILKISVLILAAFGLFSADCLASPWGQEPGQGLVITRAGYFESENNGNTFSQTESNIYAEFGLSSRTSLGGQLIYATQQQTGDTENSTGAGITAGTLFVQHQLVSLPRSQIAGKISWSAPVSLTRYRPDGTEESGGESGALAATLLYGHSVPGDAGTFLALEGGMRLSTGDDAHALLAEAVAGRDLGKRYFVHVKSFNRIALEDKEGTGADYSLSKAEICLGYKYREKRWVEIGVTSDLVADGADPGNAIFVSLWDRF